MKNRQLISALLIGLVSTSTFAGGLGLGLGASTDIGAGIGIGGSNVIQADVNHQTQIDTAAEVRANRRDAAVGNSINSTNTSSSTSGGSDANISGSADAQTQHTIRVDRPVRHVLRETSTTARGTAQAGIGLAQRGGAAMRGGVNVNADQQLQVQRAQKRQLELNAKQRVDVYGG